jgi:hypothetical protein
MSKNEDKLIEALKLRVHATMAQNLCHMYIAPTTAEKIIKAEAIFDFSLPTLLKRVYLEVGDGGFGPGLTLFLSKWWSRLPGVALRTPGDFGVHLEEFV